MSLSITKQFTIDAAPDDLFHRLTTEFTEVSSWASGVTTSEPNPNYADVADGVPGGRVCEVPGFGLLDEQLVRYEPSSRTFAYTAEAEKIPSFVSNLRNTWSLQPAGQGSTIAMHLTADVSGPLGAIMKPMMRRKFDKALEGIGADLKTYIERGSVSERKSKELAKLARKAA